MNVDDVLADPSAALELPQGAVPVSVIVLAEYVEPGSSDRPGVRRLAVAADDDLAAWSALGMLRFALQLELNEVGAEDEGDDD